MADHDHHKKEEEKETLIEKISEKIHLHRDDSSSSDDDKTASLKDKVRRIFGREQPVHKVLGGGKPADVFLWKNKKISAGVLVGATIIWLLFDVLEYHFLTLVGHGLILALAGLFLWSNATFFIKKSRPNIPEVHIPEKHVLNVASALTSEINHGLAALRNIASGKDLKKFLGAIVGLWILSILGSCCSFLTLFYTVVVLLLTIPVVYDKYEDEVDKFAEKAMVELKKQYTVFDAKVLSKIPRGPLGDKKRA